MLKANFINLTHERLRPRSILSATCGLFYSAKQAMALMSFIEFARRFRRC